MKGKLLAGLFCFGLLSASGSVIVTETAANLGDCCRSVTGYSSWTQSVTYTNVSITANLFSSGEIDPGTGVAYLVNQIGPGTTSANEVAAPVGFSVSSTTSDPVLLFSGLTLGPGTYYLVIDPTNSYLNWDDGLSPTIRTLGVGVTQAEFPDMNQGPIAAYPPASEFAFAGTAIYSVTGTLSTEVPPIPTGVPEPAPTALCAAGLSLVFFVRRMR